MRTIGMATALGILLADILLFVFYVCQYRQELGLSVNGSHDAPVARRKPARNNDGSRDGNNPAANATNSVPSPVGSRAGRGGAGAVVR
jgi:hypothetical protein